MRIAIHLGLGDTIVCAPIIAKLAESHKEIIVPCWRHNLASVESFFVDLPNVIVKVITNHSELFDYEYRLGCYGDSQKKEGESFVDWFYRQAGMSQEERLKYCPLLKASRHAYQYEVFEEEYIFIHDDKKRGYNISLNDKGCVKPTQISKSILGYAHLIKTAKEIHCIDSSFLHLSEALPTSGKLFYHKYARDYSETYNFIKDWKVIE
jgi:hypothetical protein